MRILLDYRPALRQRTGVGEYVHELARAIAGSAPPDETLLLFSASWKDRLNPAAVPGATSIDRRIPVAWLNLAWHRLQWPVAESLARQSLDIAHSAHPLLMPARNAAQLVTVHDLHFLDHPERARAEIRRDYPGLARRHAQRADRVIAVSKHTAADVEHRLGVRADRISICSPGAPDWPRRSAEPDAGCVLFLGTLEPRKNVGVLLDAYERLLRRNPAAPPLVLAGGQTAAAAPLLARVREAPLAGHVELPGYVEPDDRLGLYNRALVLVMPSHMEGFGIPALEAMTCGIPVVAANRGALPEVVGRAGRLVDPTDAEALAHALETVLGDVQTRHRMREAGWQEAGRYSWRASAAAAREAYALALDSRRNRIGSDG